MIVFGSRKNRKRVIILKKKQMNIRVSDELEKMLDRLVEANVGKDKTDVIQWAVLHMYDDWLRFNPEVKQDPIDS